MPYATAGATGGTGCRLHGIKRYTSSAGLMRVERVVDDRTLLPEEQARAKLQELLDAGWSCGETMREAIRASRPSPTARV